MHKQFAGTRISRNMRAAGYRDEEIALLLRALDLSATRNDMREAWWIVNRRHLPQVPRPELQSTLLDIVGLEELTQLVALLDKQPYRPQMSLSRVGGLQLGGASSQQQLAFMEFASVMVGMAAAPPSKGVFHFMAEELAALAGEAKAGVEAMLTGLTVLDAELMAHIPPTARARSGTVVRNMLQAGYTANQANLAIAALYVSRNQRALVKLWGMLDRDRWGSIDTAKFDRTMLLFSDVLEEDQLPELREQVMKRAAMRTAMSTRLRPACELRRHCPSPTVHCLPTYTVPAPRSWDSSVLTRSRCASSRRRCACWCRLTAHQQTCARSTPTCGWRTCSGARLMSSGCRASSSSAPRGWHSACTTSATTPRRRSSSAARSS